MGQTTTTTDIVCADPEIRPDRRKASRHKLVIEVSSDLHRRILKICATRGLPVNEAVCAVLDRSFPG